MKLSDTFLRGLKAAGKVQKHADGGGLYIHVSITGGRLWRMAYTFGGKQKTLSFGAYPAVSLKDARQKREEAKGQLASGIDPSAHKQAIKAAVRAEVTNSFEVVAREWFGKYKDSWVDHHGKKILARLENDIFPLIGGKAVGSVSAPELLEALRRIESMETLINGVHVLFRSLMRRFDAQISKNLANNTISTTFFLLLPLFFEKRAQVSLRPAGIACRPVHTSRGLCWQTECADDVYFLPDLDIQFWQNRKSV